MKKSFEIVAHAKNAVFHRNAAFILTSEEKFASFSLCDGKEFRDESEALACFDAYATQAKAAEFTAYTDVTFELTEKSGDSEEEITNHTLKIASFKVEQAA